MTTMRAVVYDSPFKVSVQNVKKPKIEHPNDVIVRGESIPSLIAFLFQTDE